MSEARRDDEPTMEEILASIRKIISEDDPEAAAAPPQDADGSGDDEEPELMELTQMVSEDGSVVDLRAEPRPSLVKFDDEPADQLPDAASEDNETAVVEPLVPEGTRVHADLVDEDEERIDFDAEETVSGAAETVPEVRANSEPEDAAEMDEAQEAPPSPVRDGLVSAEVAAAATAAMSRLKSSLAAGAPVGGGGKTLEALVCEAMTPHLKAWLDENLPDLVERVVREEIKKMVQQADHP